MNKKQKIGVTSWVLGIITMLFGAFVMFKGDIFGENNSGIAIIIGIVGIGLITSGTPIWMIKREE